MRLLLLFIIIPFLGFSQKPTKPTKPTATENPTVVQHTTNTTDALAYTNADVSSEVAIIKGNNLVCHYKKYFKFNFMDGYTQDDIYISFSQPDKIKLNDTLYFSEQIKPYWLMTSKQSNTDMKVIHENLSGYVIVTQKNEKQIVLTAYISGEANHPGHTGKKQIILSEKTYPIKSH